MTDRVLQSQPPSYRAIDQRAGRLAKADLALRDDEKCDPWPPLQPLSLFVGVLTFVDSLIGIFMASEEDKQVMQIVLELLVLSISAVMLFVESVDTAILACLRGNSSQTEGAEDDEPTVSPFVRQRRFLHYFARYLFFPMGRTVMYSFLAVLLYAQWPSRADVYLAHVLVVTALSNFAVSWTCSPKLRQLREAFVNSNDIAETFAQFPDALGNGLSPAQFKDMCRLVGISLTRNELAAAIQALDATQDGSILQAEFITWWECDI